MEDRPDSAGLPEQDLNLMLDSGSVGGDVLAGHDAVFLLPRPPPRTTAKGDQRLDLLEKLGQPVATPRPSADRATLLTEVGVEETCVFACSSHR